MKERYPEITTALDDIASIIHAPIQDVRTLGERAGAYAALCERGRFLEKRLESENLSNGYAVEKLVKTINHGAGMLGFGERRDRRASRERISAIGNLFMLRSVLNDQLGNRLEP